jgi:hypothetical protein
MQRSLISATAAPGPPDFGDTWVNRARKPEGVAASRHTRIISTQSTVPLGARTPGTMIAPRHQSVTPLHAHMILVWGGFGSTVWKGGADGTGGEATKN